jgi:ATP-dependent Clp protease ATP-binding subunit ClpB
MPGAAEERYEQMKAAVMEVVGQHFRPEFINRIDEAVVFHPLGREQIRAITEIQIGYLRRRLADREMGLEVSRGALDRLGEAGFDPVYGARPLKRAIQQQLENPLAQEILAGVFGPGDVVHVNVNADGLTFSRGRNVDVDAEGAVIEGEIVD